MVNVDVGETARIKVDAYPGKLLTGTVKQIASTATVKNEGTQQEVTNFEVRIQVANPPVQLRPGMSASVDIETQTAHQRCRGADPIGDGPEQREWQNGRTTETRPRKTDRCEPERAGTANQKGTPTSGLFEGGRHGKAGPGPNGNRG